MRPFVTRFSRVFFFFFFSPLRRALFPSHGKRRESVVSRPPGEMMHKKFTLLTFARRERRTLLIALTNLPVSRASSRLTEYRVARGKNPLRKHSVAARDLRYIDGGESRGRKGWGYRETDDRVRKRAVGPGGTSALVGSLSLCRTCMYVRARIRTYTLACAAASCYIRDARDSGRESERERARENPGR